MIGFRGGMSGFLRIGSKHMKYAVLTGDLNLFDRHPTKREVPSAKKLKIFAKHQNAADNVLLWAKPKTNYAENPRTRE